MNKIILVFIHLVLMSSVYAIDPRNPFFGDKLDMTDAETVILKANKYQIKYNVRGDSAVELFRVLVDLGYELTDEQDHENNYKIINGRNITCKYIVPEGRVFSKARDYFQIAVTDNYSCIMNVGAL